MSDSHERICAITGGAGALGSALAELLAKRGYAVVLLDTERGKERAETLAARLGNDHAIAVTGDFAEADAWTAALEATKRAFGHAPSHAALIAGGWEGGKPLHEEEDGVYERLVRSNLDTAHRGLRALLGPMVAAKQGSIVVVGSRAALRPWTSTGAAVYAAAKSAVVALAEAAAAEVLADGVRINAILPSTMDTPANRAAMPKADPSTWVSLSSAAGVIAFLLSEDARDVSGAAIPVYGRA